MRQKPPVSSCPPLSTVAADGGGLLPAALRPFLQRLLREKLESLLPQHLGQVAHYAGQLRARVKKQFATMGERRRFWEKLFINDRLAQSLANADAKAVSEITEQMLSEPLDHRGEVVLVGAGPGDAGLLTLKGLQQIQQADVVVYDRLVSDDIMNLVRRDADRVFVGKRAGYHCVPQEEINQILLREAQKGKRVVASERRRSVYLRSRRRRAGKRCATPAFRSRLFPVLPRPPGARLIPAFR
ncbi:siroheme synthase [Citrobacter koseri]|uniref:uroporphyrinogen-III C-methyltransferase n=1 Tax=Citrobacter koseri TaxID=545 RepID=A0A2X2WM93_CITKO|nr:siroheme synthase [Citrobacter koseri]